MRFFSRQCGVCLMTDRDIWVIYPGFELPENAPCPMCGAAMVPYRVGFARTLEPAETVVVSYKHDPVNEPCTL